MFQDNTFFLDIDNITASSMFICNISGVAMRRHGCMCFHIVSAKKAGGKVRKKERKENVLAYPVDLHERGD